MCSPAIGRISHPTGQACLERHRSCFLRIHWLRCHFDYCGRVQESQHDLPRATIITLSYLYVALYRHCTGVDGHGFLQRTRRLRSVGVRLRKVQSQVDGGIVSLSAVIAITSVFLVFQIGQPRIWMRCSRWALAQSLCFDSSTFQDPRFLDSYHRFFSCRSHALSQSSVRHGPLQHRDIVAFMLVSAGILALDDQEPHPHTGTFRVPYINGAYFMPFVWAGYTVAVVYWLPDNHNIFRRLAYEKLPYAVFYLALVSLTITTVWRGWSLIPVLGVLTNLYLIAGLGTKTWEGYLVWCVIGLVIYFCYGYSHSKLGRAEQTSVEGSRG